MDEHALAALELAAYLDALRACRRCPAVEPPPVVGAVAGARILLVGQAPGPRERDDGRPFVWTAGTTLFRWLASIGAEEDAFRRRVYMAAVIRCFPGKNVARNPGKNAARNRAPGGAKAQGDRAPSRAEIANCRPHLASELRRLRPALVLPVGRLAIAAFVPHRRLDEVVGRSFALAQEGPGRPGGSVIPLPHPSGLSAWHKTEPGKTLLAQALALIAEHPQWRETFPSPRH